MRSSARASGLESVTLAERTRYKADTHGQVSAAAQANLYKVWDTFAASGAVEVKIAGECEKMANALDGGASVPDAMAQADQLKVLVDQRMALDRERRQYVSQLH